MSSPTAPTAPTTVPGVDGLDAASLEKRLTRRIQRLHIFKAPGSAPIPDNVTSGVNPELMQLNTADGWLDMGLVGSDNAPVVSRDTDQSDLTAIGFRDPVRSDMTKDTVSFQATFLEHRRVVIETYDNIDMRGLKPDPQTGEVKWVRPADGPMITSRYALYGEDGAGADRVWIVKFITAGILQEVDDQTWGGDDYLTFNVTIRGLTDTQLGTSMITHMGGPGWKSLNKVAGFGS